MLAVTNAEAHNEIVLGVLWLLGCALGGSLFGLFGPRALGLGLWSSIVGGGLGFMAVSSNFDSLPAGAAVGATVGFFAGGLLGLPFRPEVSTRAATVLACLVAIVGIGVLTLIHLGASFPCRRTLCFPTWTADFQRLFAADVAFAVFLCLLEAWRARRRETHPSRPGINPLPVDDDHRDLPPASGPRSSWRDVPRREPW